MKRLNPFPTLALAIFLTIFGMKIDSPYYLGVAIMIMIHSLNASGFNLLLGYTGIISLGQAAFFGLGAYISGVLSSAYGWDAILTLPVAAVSAFFLALLVGWPVLRLHGHYLAMATLGFGMIMYIFMNEMSFITGGPSGLMGIGDFTLFGKAFPFEDEFFIVMSVYFILALTILELIDKSFLHYKMKFIKSSETASASYGINVVSTKLFVFASVAAFTALNGSMYAFYTHFISPVSFGLKYSIELVAMATVGGLGYVTGGVVGAVLLGLIPELFAGLEEFEMIIYGTFLAVVVMFAPGGVVGTVIKLWRRKDA